MNKIALFTHKLLFPLTAFLFAFIPLYPKYPLINVTGTFVAIRIEDLLIALSLVVWIIYIISSKGINKLLKDKIFQVILLFFFIGILSTISAVYLTQTAVANLSIFHLFRRIEFILLLPLVATVVTSKKQIISLLFLLFVVLLLVNIYALGQQYLDWPVISTTNSEFSKGLILRLTEGARVNSTFAGHYDLAVFLAMSLVFISAIFFAVKKRIKLLLVLIGGFSLLILIMTAARQSFVAAFAGSLLVLWITGKKKYILIVLIFAGLILLYPSQLRDRLISTVTVNIFKQGQRFTPQTNDQEVRSKLNIPTLAVKTSSNSANTSTFASRSADIATDITPGEPIDTTQLGVFRSFEIRLNIEWPRAINAFIKNPFLGTGYSSLGIATDNDFLRSIGEVGVLGTWALILILVKAGKTLYKNIKVSDKLIKYFSSGVFCMMIAFILNGLFIDVFEASKVASLFWMMLGLGLSVKNINENT